jgi:hypothetical protein
LSARALTLPRILAVLAAACFVGAFALAVYFPPEASLRHLARMVDADAVLAVQEWTRVHLGDWALANVLLPVLMRPAWLALASIGAIFGGLALTRRSGRSVPGSPRWRN